MVDYVKPSGLDKIWAATGVKTPAPDASKISAGWVVEIPPMEYFNYLEYKQDAFIAHVNQKGGVTWDSTTEYLTNISYAFGSNGILYKCLIGNTGINPVTDVGGNWRVAYYFTTDVYTKVESDAKYLNKGANLSDLANITTSRTNLSVYSKAETDAKYPTIANNLSDVNPITARSNLFVYSQTESDARYTLRANNLSDVNSIVSARVNLGVSSTAEANDLYTAKTANLADVASIATSRTNLSVYSKAESNGRYNLITNNLGDVPDISIARTNLSVYAKSETDGKYLTFTGNLSGLTDPAAAFNTIKQQASDSYVGVSQFASDAELLAGSVTNKVVAPSKLRLGFSISLSTNGHFKFPTWLGGLVINWGVISALPTNSATSPTMSSPFATACIFTVCGLAESTTVQFDHQYSPYSYKSGATITVVNPDDTNASNINWLAFGY